MDHQTWQREIENGQALKEAYERPAILYRGQLEAASANPKVVPTNPACNQNAS